MGDSRTNFELFQAALQRHYEALCKDPSHAWRYSMTPPTTLAAKMTAALQGGTADKAGEGIRRTCKELGLPHTYKAIEAYLKG